jgi:hypothetical protein
VRGTLKEEYRLLSRKYSFANLAESDDDDENEEGGSFNSDHYLEMRKQQVMEAIFLDQNNPYKL